MKSIAMASLAATGSIILAAVSLAVAAEAPPASTALKFLAYDPFDGKTGLNWKIVRPDPGHLVIGKRPNRLTITTQDGTIHRKFTRQLARNIYLLDNPLGPKADWSVATCISGFSPTEAYQQAGLICYDDDDNYVKWVYQFNVRSGAGQSLVFLRETEANSSGESYEPAAGWPKVWLRLTKRCDRYECLSSLDGKEFKKHSDATWGNGAPKSIGLIAKNGGSKAPEIDADFEFFELRSPPAAQAEVKP